MTEPTKTRVAQYAVADLFIERWSPRAFTAAAIPDAELYSLFEAARWAPSAGNSQPWRILFAKRDTPEFSTFLGVLNSRNQVWARRAAALIIMVSKTSQPASGDKPASPLTHHSFDTGAAWANLALQAHLTGWSAHAMAGYDPVKARADLSIPADFHPEAAIAVGKHGDVDQLPDDLRAREQKSGRLPISEIVIGSRFSA